MTFSRQSTRSPELGGERIKIRVRKEVRELSVMNLEVPFAAALASPVPQPDISGSHPTEDAAGAAGSRVRAMDSDSDYIIAKGWSLVYDSARPSLYGSRTCGRPGAPPVGFKVHHSIDLS